MFIDHYAHLYFENPDRQDDVVDDDFDVNKIVQEINEEEERLAETDDWEDLTPDD